MRNVCPLTQRELAASFLSPIAYVVGAIFLVASGLWFVSNVFEAGNEASMRPLFEGMVYVLVFCAPLLTMRTVAEELSSGTIETLMTAPVTDAEVILGKFFGVLAFYAALLAATLPFLFMLKAYGSPQLGVVFFSYVGMLLLGGMYLSVGLFTSCCTRHQLLAAVLAIAILSLFVVVDWVVDLAQAKARGVLMTINVPAYFEEFAKGMLDTRSLVFFVSSTAFFLFLATKVLESKRWR